MGIRETLNQNPAITTGVTIGIIVIALGFIGWQVLSGDGAPSAVTKMYYTVDDGATYFADDANKLSPFDHEGKPAVRCYVFTCDKKKSQFVAYLERLTPEAQKKMAAALEAQKKAVPTAPGANVPGPFGPETDFIAQEGTEVKKPGAPKWFKRNSVEGEKAVQPSCPDGKNEMLDIVLPGD